MNFLIEEKMILLEIEAQYQTLITLLIELRQMCKLRPYQAAEILHTDASSITRYEKNEQTMGLDKFVQFCFYYMEYIKKNNIQCTPEVRKAIRKSCIHAFISSDFWDFDPDSKE